MTDGSAHIKNVVYIPLWGFVPFGKRGKGFLLTKRTCANKKAPEIQGQIFNIPLNFIFCYLI
jgi:hypothetical protein